MKIGILGAGNVGGRLADLARTAGHEVHVGSRNGPVSIAEAIEASQIVIIAIHYHAVEEVLAPLVDKLAGKIIIDATNPLNDDWSPLLLGQESSAGQKTADLLPGAKVVKAFNTVFADIMTPERQDRDGQKITAFVASDHDDALDTVRQLAISIGFEPVTVNKLSASRYLEAMAHLNIELAVGQGGGTNAAILYHRP